MNKDGTELSVLLHGLRQPTNLVIDQTIGALYWLEETDGGHVIYTVQLDNINSKKVLWNNTLYLYMHTYFIKLEYVS